MLALATILSGCAALLYQLIWTRAIGLVMGHSLTAVATVVALFMAGLGTGSALAARFVDRRRLAPARLYALLELGIAVSALLVPLLLGAATPLLQRVYDPSNADAAALVLLRLASSAAVLLVPTTLMGATLAVLVAVAAPETRRVGVTAGRLYAWNTAGAIAGSLGGALFLLPALGMRGTLAFAAGLNVIAALVVGRRRTPEPLAEAEPAPAPAPSAKRRKKKEKQEREDTPENLPLWVTIAAAVVAGFAGIANEVAWTRALVLLIGPTAYAFAFILTAVVAGIALGSAAASALLPRLRRVTPALGCALVSSALLSLLVTHRIGASILLVGEFVRANADHMDVLLRAELGFVLALLVPPAAFTGAVFPLAARLVAEQVGGAARPIGILYAWNTLGAIAGSLAAGFALLPAFGLERTLLGLALLQGALGALVFLAPRPSGIRALGAAAAVAMLGLAFSRVAPWDRELLAGGVYKYAAYTAGGATVEQTIRAGELLSYEEGALATVSVKRLGGTLSLAIDGKVDATSSGDMATQRLLAHVPMLLHRNPRRVMVIGLGSGVTAGSALSHPVERVDAVEILPEVARAARRFAKANHEALDDPRLRLIVADGRNHVLLSRDSYDVIISEPSNPWMAGVSALFTRDFFALAKRRLAEGGLFCQWAHVYNLSEQDLKTVIAGFSDVFPEAALFLINEGDVLLVGGGGPLPLDRASLERRIGEGRVGLDLREIGVVDPFVFASLYTLSPQGLRRLAAGAARHSDDRPILEFRAPRALHENTGRTNAQLLIAAGREAPRPEPWAELVRNPGAVQLAARARMLERAEGDYWAFELYEQAIAKEPRSLPALEGYARCAVRSDRIAVAEKRLRELGETAAPVEARIALGLLLTNAGRTEEALAALQGALERDPKQRRALILAAEVQEQAGHLEAMEGLARQALSVAPGDIEAEALLASAALGKGLKLAAIAIADRVLARDPNETRALQVAAFARADDDRAGARRFLERLVEAEPDIPGHWANFGAFELAGKDYRAAVRLFETAADLNPGDPRAYLGLREAGRGLGDPALVARADKFLKSRGL